MKTPALESYFYLSYTPQAYNFIKKILQYSCFPVKFAKLLRTPSLKNHLSMTASVFKVHFIFLAEFEFK